MDYEGRRLQFGSKVIKLYLYPTDKLIEQRGECNKLINASDTNNALWIEYIRDAIEEELDMRGVEWDMS